MSSLYVSHQVSLSLNLTSYHRSSSFIHQILTTGPHLINSLRIWNIGVSVFHSLMSGSSQPAAATQLTNIDIYNCDLNERNDVTASDVFESIIMYALHHAPRIQEI